jgi:hypothetical protein
MVPFLHRDLGEGPAYDVSAHAGVVYQDINPAEPLKGNSDHVRYLGLVSHIYVHAQGLASSGHDLGRGIPGLLESNVGADHAGPFARQTQGIGPAKTDTTTGYNSYFV